MLSLDEEAPLLENKRSGSGRGNSSVSHGHSWTDQDVSITVREGGGSSSSAPLKKAEQHDNDTALTAAEQAAWVVEELLRGQPITSASDVGSSRSARTSYLRLRHSEPVQQVLVVALMVLSFLEPPAWCAKVGCPAAAHERAAYVMSGIQGQVSRAVATCLEGLLLGLLLTVALVGLAFVEQPLVSRKRLQVKAVLVVVAATDWAVCVFGGNTRWRLAAPLRVSLIIIYFASLYDVAAGLVTVLPAFVSVFSMVCLFTLVAGWMAALLFHDLPGGSGIQLYYGSLLRGVYTMFVVLTTADFPLQMMDVYYSAGASAFFFVIVILVGVVFLLGLVTATVYNTYTEHLRRWTAQKARVHTEGLSVAYDLLRSNRGAENTTTPSQHGQSTVNEDTTGSGEGQGGSAGDNSDLSSASLKAACADGDADGDMERCVGQFVSPRTGVDAGDGRGYKDGRRDVIGTFDNASGGKLVADSGVSSGVPRIDVELRPRHLRALFREMQKNETLATADLSRADLVFKVLDDDGDNALSLEEFEDLFDALELKFESMQRQTVLERRLPWLYRAPRFAQLMKWVRADDSFSVFINVVMVVNILVVMVETHLDLANADSTFSVIAFAWLELAFSVVYIGEVVLRLMAVGGRAYWRQFGNRFDLCAVVLLLASTMYVVIDPSEQSTATVRMFILLRLLRLLSLVADISNFRLLGRTVCVAGAVSLPLLTLLFLCIFCFSSLGVQLFGGLLWTGNPALDPEVNPSVSAFVSNEYMALNFNDVGSGCLALFSAMVVAYLTELANAIVVTSNSELSLLFFATFYVCSVLIIGNVVFALLIDVLISTQERLSGEEATGERISVTQLSQRYGLRHVKVSHSGTTLTHERVFCKFFKEQLNTI
ncbi:hypothetical protein MMPV_004760 [Pyropia vietnamensis]